MSKCFLHQSVFFCFFCIVIIIDIIIIIIIIVVTIIIIIIIIILFWTSTPFQCYISTQLTLKCWDVISVPVWIVMDGNV